MFVCVIGYVARPVAITLKHWNKIQPIFYICKRYAEASHETIKYIYFVIFPSKWVSRATILGKIKNNQQDI